LRNSQCSFTNRGEVPVCRLADARKAKTFARQCGIVQCRKDTRLHQTRRIRDVIAVDGNPLQDNSLRGRAKSEGVAAIVKDEAAGRAEPPGL
jgi:hypothetical protein